VFDASGHRLYVNRAAERMAGPGIRQALVAGATTEVAAEVRHAGRAVSRQLEASGRPPRSFVLEGHPLDGQTLVIIRDMTGFSQLENVRRDFVANVSHELRTPIGAISVLADALAGSPAADDAQRLAQRIRSEVDRLSDLVSNLLDLSRIEALRPEIGGPPVDLAGVAAEAVDCVRHLSRNANVAIELESPAEDVRLPGDRAQLLSAITNLLDNAVKYSDPGQSVRVTVTHSPAGGAVVEVADQGIGIPSRDLDRVFERFYRTDRSRRRYSAGSPGGTTPGGTGLGLSIVRTVAENHGGTVHVESREGEGSTFRIELPGSFT
jgi:two-component system, OmpR family, sensor histidine kinase SenX3